MPTQQAVRTSIVDHALGVHTDLTQGNWTSIESMISQAKYAGIDTMRVGMPYPDHWTTPYVEKIIAAGLKIEVVVDAATSPTLNAKTLADFMILHPGSIAFVEGPNEPNNWGVNYAGKSGVEGAVAWQSDFYAAMKASQVTALVPVGGMASWPNIAAASDLNNLHPYPKNGDQPLARLQDELSRQDAVDPGKDFVITEAGYYTLPGENTNGVDDVTQAKLIVNTYMDSISLGAKNVGIYALRDWVYSDSGAHYGLFFDDGTPKPAATALHNVQTILQDDGATSASFVPGLLDFTNSVPVDVHTLLMQKSSGEYVLALWREPDVWDAATEQQIQASTESFTLNTGSATEFSVYDPLVGDTAIRREVSSTGLALTMTDHPVFITFLPGAPGSSTPQLTAKPAVTTLIGTGVDTLIVKVSEDAYNGHADYTLKVDGMQVGGTLTAFGSHALGQSDTVTLLGNWGSAAHKVEVNFLNDAWGGTSATDRNFYVEGITYNGVALPSSTSAMVFSGAIQFSVPQSSLIGDGANNSITGTPGNDTIKGLGGDDNLMGAGGSDTIEGGDGNDTIGGGDGNDWLDGGTGADKMTGGTGDDAFLVDNLGDTTVELASGGYDRVVASISGYTLAANVERLDLSGTALTGMGNALANVIVGNAFDDSLNGMGGDDQIFGNMGNDSLYGGDGSDILYGGDGNDRLDGGTGADLMIGGAGDDLYLIDNLGDVISEVSGGGYERVVVTVSGYMLAANVERIDLSGSAVTGSGNEISNTVIGNSHNNLLNGLAGHDTMSGGAGNDTLVGGIGFDIIDGGAGADVFRYGSAAEGDDTITDFLAGTDVIEASVTGFKGGLTLSTSVAGRFVANTTGLATAPSGTGQFIYETDVAKLLWDADGAGGAAAVTIATFATGNMLHASDIHLIG